MNEIKVIEHSLLLPGTIIVSSDVAKLMRELYLETSLDNAFLKAIGIKESCEERH
jgi:hypothetical protein